MRRVALITDMHWGVRNDHPAFVNNAVKSINWVHNVLKNDYPDIDHVINLGDLYDRHKYINFKTANACRTSYLELFGKNYSNVILMGNHDCYYKDNHEINSLKEMKTIYGANKIWTAKEIMLFGIPILMMPWICESNRQFAIDAIQNTKAEILMGHLELNGFEMHKNVVMSHGDDPSIYSKFKAVYSGHFHRKSSKGNIHYIGALGEYTWSDYNCPRGFSVLDLDTLKLEFIENPHRMFRQVTYDDTNYKPGDFNKIDFSEYTESFVKVLVAKRNDMFAFDIFMNKMHDANPIDVSVIDDVSSFVDNEEDEIIDEAQDTPTILDGYISGLSLPVKNDVMKDYMRNVYKEALTVEDVK